MYSMSTRVYSWRGPIEFYKKHPRKGDVKRALKEITALFSELLEIVAQDGHDIQSLIKEYELGIDLMKVMP